MADVEQPRIYLVTPAGFSLSRFPDTLARVLDSAPVACVRLALAGTDIDRVARAGDALRKVAHARDVPLVVAEHVALVGRLGLDGVHLGDGARSVRRVRRMLGRDAIVGAHCGASRHDGMAAGEAGADYVGFGPVRETALGHGVPAEPALFEWWAEMIALPVVAEGAIDVESARRLAPFADFLALGDEIWSQPDPVAALSAYFRAITPGGAWPNAHRPQA